MIEYADIDGFVLHDLSSHTTTVDVESVRGLFGTPSPKQDLVDRPRAHGASDYTEFYEGKVIELGGRAWAATDDGLHDVIDALQAALALDGGDRVFTFRRRGRSFEERAVVRVATEVASENAGWNQTEAWAVSLYAPDPRLYTANQKTNFYSPSSNVGGGVSFELSFPITFAGGSGLSSMAVTNAGTRKTPPTYTLLGPATDPTIRNETTGQDIDLTGSIISTDELVVDVARRSIVLNGTERADFLAVATSQWAELAPGTNTIRLVATGTIEGTTRLVAVWRDARN